MGVIAAPNPLEILLLILLGGGFAVPPAEEVRVAANVAPADCLFYASWAGTGTPEAKSPNQTEQLLAEQEVRDFLGVAQKRMLDIVQQMAARQSNAGQTANVVSKLLELARGKPGVIYVRELSFKADGPPDLKGAALLQLGDKTVELRKFLEEVQCQALKDKVSVVKIGGQDFQRIRFNEQTPPVAWGIVGEYLAVGLGDGELEGLITRMNGQPPGWLKDIRARLSVPRVSSVVYLNVSRLVKLATAEAHSAEVGRAISALGLDKLGTFAAVGGLDEKGCVTRALLSVDGKGTGLLSWLDGKPLSADDLGPIGPDALGAVALQLDVSWLVDLWLKTANEINPREAEQMRRGLEFTGGALGFDVREDLLKSIGDTWRVFVQPVGPGTLIHGWTLAVPVRDRAKLKRVQDAVVAQMKSSLERGGDGIPTLTSGSRINGNEVYTLDFAPVGAPVAPSWCLTEKEFVLAATPETLGQFFSSGSGRSLARQPDVAPLVGKDAKTLAFAYLDTRAIAETILPKLPQLLAGFSRGMMPVDTSRLPSSKVFLPHLQPSVFSVSRAADGVELLSRRTLPGENLGPAVPLAALMATRAVFASRGAAHRMQGMNQLKQIALALHNFAQAFGALPAGYNADANGKPLLSWRVHILPYLDETALYQQFHLDEPWDSPHNKELIERMPRVYRAPNSKGKPGMTNYLGVSGADGVFIRPAPGGKTGTTFAQIRDGSSNTIMTVEVPDESAVIWTKPGDFAPNKQKPTRGLLGLNPGGFHAGLADGSVRFISENINAATLRALFTKAGGEQINNPF
jgi:hypothetical protein